MTRIESPDELKEEYRDCREHGHWWAKIRRQTTKRKVSTGQKVGELRMTECQRCGLIREQLFELDVANGVMFAVSAPRSHYPDGYLFKKGIRLSRAQMRALNLLREIQIVKPRRKKS